MPRERTPDSRSFLSKTMDSFVRNRRPGGDIQLPNQSGIVDPRLRKPDVGGSLREAAKGLGAVRKLGGR